MLVLNRRPGESIIIEPDIRATVLSVREGRVWIGLHAPGTVPDLRFSASVVSDTATRLEIEPVVSVAFGADGVRMRSAPASSPAAAMQAGLSLSQGVGERLQIDDDLWVETATLPKGNPSVAFGGPSIGERFALAVIRPTGNYVRIGVDAPSRRVYRTELWDAAHTGSSAPASPAAGATVVGR